MKTVFLRRLKIYSS